MSENNEKFMSHYPDAQVDVLKCLVLPKILKMFNSQRKAANLHIREAGTREFLLKKLLKQLIH